ncbi:MAG: leucyl aminopeptidase [Promicromonosporaceae bacterium]|nr:leucyl aminopeptidase [Promicromonosporaceae bacterium]
MAQLTLSSKNPTATKADALIIGVAKTSDGAAIIGDQLPPEFVQQLETLSTTLSITGAPDEVRKLPAPEAVSAGVLVLTGLGERDDEGAFKAETLRRAAGAAIREVAGSASAVIALPTLSDDDVAAVAEGALLGAYAISGLKSDEEAIAKAAPVETIEINTQFTRSQRAKAAAERAEVLAEAVHATRDLVNTPSNLLFPATFAEAAKAAVKDATAKGAKGLKVTVLDDRALLAGGYGGIMGVGQGSARPPRLVKVAYTPAKASGDMAQIGLIGKGITFDTGGISIKPSASMEQMTMDMAGAAAVLHTTIAAARLALPVAVTAYLCLAENMPGGGAMRPGDVITIRGGKTVEVINTDAEGRLVMADGLVAAIEDGHDTVIDIATLTGAQMAALGARTAGVMGTDCVRTALHEAAEAAGESNWPMLLPDYLATGLKSNVADMMNVSNERLAGMQVAGLFLSKFVGDTPWGHLDIAGPAWNTGSPYGYLGKAATGYGVRTLLKYLETRAA